MPTIIEHDTQHDGGSSSAITAIVAILAIIIVAGIAAYFLRLYPFSQLPADSGAPASVNVNVNGALSSSLPSGR